MNWELGDKLIYIFRLVCLMHSYCLKTLNNLINYWSLHNLFATGFATEWHLLAKPKKNQRIVTFSRCLRHSDYILCYNIIKFYKAINSQIIFWNIE